MELLRELPTGGSVTEQLGISGGHLNRTVRFEHSERLALRNQRRAKRCVG
jgi:hypothetical protein